MKKALCILLTVALLLMTSAGALAENIVIGGTGPLTGDYANYGISMRNGAQIAVDEINALGGINGWQIEFYMEDDGGDAASAVNAYGVLIDRGMQLSIGSTLSGACLDLATESQEDGILVLATTASMKECVQYDNCFRICFTDPYQGVLSADFIAQNHIATKIAIIYDKSNDYSVGITDNFEAEAAAVGLEIVTKQAFTNQSNTDFAVQLQAVKESGAELVFLPIYTQEAVYILTQAKAAGIETLFFGCDGMDGVIGKIGEDNLDACEGVMLLTPFAADAQDDLTVAFTTAYQERFGEIPDQFAADGYDAIYTLKAAVEAAGVESLDDPDFNEKVIAAMLTITVEGLTGTMTWSEDGEVSKTAKAMVIVDSAYKAYSAE